MVDPIGPKPVSTGDRKIVETTRSTAATPAVTSITARGQDQVASRTVVTAQELAASPPVDYERIAQIRKAIADGTFPIVPAQIADRLIAARYDWARHDAE